MTLKLFLLISVLGAIGATGWQLTSQLQCYVSIACGEGGYFQESQFTYIACIGGFSSTLEIQAPKFVLSQDTFTVVCSSSQPVGISVNYCKVIPGSTRREKNGSGLSLRIVAHSETACEVWCFAANKREKQIIPVIRKRIYMTIDIYYINTH